MALSDFRRESAEGRRPRTNFDGLLLHIVGLGLLSAGAKPSILCMPYHVCRLDLSFTRQLASPSQHFADVVGPIPSSFSRAPGVSGFSIFDAML